MKNLKDPVSSLTHYFAMILAIIFGIPLIVKGFQYSLVAGVSMLIFVLSMIGLYCASGTYHALNISKTVNSLLKKLDHSMIFVLIAATYTPICTLVIKSTLGNVILCVMWGLTVIGIVFKFFWIYHPKWLSSVMFIAMGWMSILAIKPLLINLPFDGLLWLVSGGIIYTIGGVIYGFKFKKFNSKHKYFGSHEIFHLFVMGGSACHFVLMFNYVLKS